MLAEVSLPRGTSPWVACWEEAAAREVAGLLHASGNHLGSRPDHDYGVDILAFNLAPILWRPLKVRGVDSRHCVVRSVVLAEFGIKVAIPLLIGNAYVMFPVPIQDQVRRQLQHQTIKIMMGRKSNQFGQ